jgi:hypothetical protein
VLLGCSQSWQVLLSRRALSTSTSSQRIQMDFPARPMPECGRVALALRTPVAPPVLGDKGASQSGRAGVRALRDARGCSTQASVGTLAPKDLAARRSARATVSRRPMLPLMWAQERKAVALQSVGIFSDCWALLGRPRRALDRTASGSVATCIRAPTFGGSAHPTSVPRQARQVRSWSAVAPSDPLHTRLGRKFGQGHSREGEGNGRIGLWRRAGQSPGRHRSATSAYRCSVRLRWRAPRRAGQCGLTGR